MNFERIENLAENFAKGNQEVKNQFSEGAEQIVNSLWVFEPKENWKRGVRNELLAVFRDTERVWNRRSAFFKVRGPFNKIDTENFTLAEEPLIFGILKNLSDFENWKSQNPDFENWPEAKKEGAKQYFDGIFKGQDEKPSSYRPVLAIDLTGKIRPSGIVETLFADKDWDWIKNGYRNGMKWCYVDEILPNRY